MYRTPFNYSNELLEINITLDEVLIQDATDLGVFSVVLHENLHALLAYFLEIELINSNDENQDLAALAKEYIKRKTNDVSDPEVALDLEHKIMTELISVLTLEIKNYALSKGYEIDEFIYESLALGGIGKNENICR